MALHAGPTLPEGDGKAAQAAESKEAAKATVDGVMDEVDLSTEKKETLRSLSAMTAKVHDWAQHKLITEKQFIGWGVNVQLFQQGKLIREQLDYVFDMIAIDASEARTAREGKSKKPADAAPSPRTTERRSSGREAYEENIGDYYQMKPEGIVITIDKVEDPNAYRYSTLAGIIGPQGQEKVPEGKTLALFIDNEFVPLTYVEAENDWKLDGAHKNVGEVSREKYYFVDAQPAPVDGKDAPKDDVDGDGTDVPKDDVDGDGAASPDDFTDDFDDWDDDDVEIDTTSPEVVTRKSIEAIGEHLGLDYDTVKGLIQDDLAALGLPLDTPISNPQYSVGIGVAILSYDAGGKTYAHVGRVKNVDKVMKDYDKSDKKAERRLVRRWKMLEDAPIEGVEANAIALARFDEMGDYSAPGTGDVIGVGSTIESNDEAITVAEDHLEINGEKVSASVNGQPITFDRIEDGIVYFHLPEEAGHGTDKNVPLSVLMDGIVSGEPTRLSYAHDDHNHTFTIDWSKAA